MLIEEHRLLLNLTELRATRALGLKLRTAKSATADPFHLELHFDTTVARDRWLEKWRDPIMQQIDSELPKEPPI